MSSERYDLTELKNRIRISGVPRRSRTNNLLLLTWNIAQFNQNKPPKSFAYMKEIMKRFDVIAIQEVKDNLGGIEKLQKVLGKNYRFIFSDAAGNNERLVFCYYKQNVKFTGLSAEVVNNPGYGREKDAQSNLLLFGKTKPNTTFKFKAGSTLEKYKIRKIIEFFSNNIRIGRIEITSSSENSIKIGTTYQDSNVRLKIKNFKKTFYKKGDIKNGWYLTLKYIGNKKVDIIIKDKVLEFDRSPYVVSFSKHGCNFIVTNVHIFYGDNKSIVFRKQELSLLAEYLEKRSSDADALDPDYIACGDFNIEKAVNSELKQLSNTIVTNQSKSDIVNSLFDALTSKGLIIPDVIKDSGSNLDRTKHFDQIGYHEYDDSTIVFKKGGVIDFVGAVFPELGQNPLSSRRTRDQLKTKLSDHLPMWAEFSIQPDSDPVKINVN